jgi:hypothetical protein
VLGEAILAAKITDVGSVEDSKRVKLAVQINELCTAIWKHHLWRPKWGTGVARLRHIVLLH